MLLSFCVLNTHHMKYFTFTNKLSNHPPPKTNPILDNVEINIILTSSQKPFLVKTNCKTKKTLTNTC